MGRPGEQYQAKPNAQVDGMEEMTRENDGMRGTWYFTGTHWMCDCYSGGPLLQIGFGQGGQITSGKCQSIHTSRCYRCGVLRPLKKHKPEAGQLPLPGEM